jgi:hypothetical protein
MERLVQLDVVLKYAWYAIIGASVVMSPFAPAIARRLGKDYARTARGFAIIDGFVLLWRAVDLGGRYYAVAVMRPFIASFPLQVWILGWAEVVVCLAAFVWTLLIAVRASRTTTSTTLTEARDREGR